MTDRNTWLKDYEQHCKQTREDVAAKRVFDALDACDLLKTKFQATDTQRRAIFVVKEVPDFELIRVVVRLDAGQLFVAYNTRAESNKKWPKQWERDFEASFGIAPRMGAYIVKWCVKSHDNTNTDRLIQWLISKAQLKSGLVAPEHHALTTSETSVIRNDDRLKSPETQKNDLHADLKAEVIAPCIFPDEIQGDEKIFEGARQQILVNAYERKPAARRRCIEHYGLICAVCNFDFAVNYGAVGEGLIHVHHLRELSEIGEEYEVDPIRDLRPVCPNCHFVIHQRRPCYSIDEVKAFLRH